MQSLSTSVRCLGSAPLIALAIAFCSALPCAAAQLYSLTHPNDRINLHDADTGDILNSFAPPSPAQSSGGNGLAFSGSTLFYSHISTNSIYRLNPVTGAVMGSMAAQTGIDALAYGVTSFGDTLFTLDYNLNRVNLINPLTGAVFATRNLLFDAVGGMDFNSVTNTLYISADSVIHRVDPANGMSLGSFNTGNGFQSGIGLVGGRLFTATRSPGQIVERHPITGAIIHSFPFQPDFAALAGGPIPEPTMLAMIPGSAALIALRRRKLAAKA